MIKIKSIISMILIICVLTLSSCKKEQPDTSSETPTSSSSSANTSSVVATEQMSYEEYFSKEREFVRERKLDPNKDIGCFINQDDHNYLYLMDYTTKEIKLINAEETEDTICYKGKIYAITNKTQIISINPDGSEKTVVYQDNIPLKCLFMDDSVMYFMKNNTVYRLFRATNKLEEIYHNDEMVRFILLSNYAIMWEKDNPEWIKYYNETKDWENKKGIQEKICYTYNWKTNEMYEKDYYKSILAGEEYYHVDKD